MSVVTYDRVPTRRIWHRQKCLDFIERRRTTVLKKTCDDYLRVINLIFDKLVDPGYLVPSKMDTFRQSMNIGFYWRYEKDAKREDMSDYHSGFSLYKGSVWPHPGAGYQMGMPGGFPPIAGQKDKEIIDSILLCLGSGGKLKLKRLHRFT